MIIDERASRRVARRRRLHRLLALFCALGAGVVTMLALAARTNGDTRIGADTRFDYVAVFAPGTSSADIERWRAGVMRVHVTPCVARLPCTMRALRFAALGPDRRDAIAFDLDRAVTADERAAIVAAASADPARVHLVAATTPRRAAGD